MVFIFLCEIAELPVFVLGQKQRVAGAAGNVTVLHVLLVLSSLGTAGSGDTFALSLRSALFRPL